MSKQYAVPAKEQLETSERLFDALSSLEALTRAADPPQPRPIVFSRLYDYATQGGRATDRELERAIAGDPRLCADFRRLLEKTAASRLPRSAAASTGILERREGEGCRIRFEKSRAEPTQTFVMIELADTEAPPPSVLFVCDVDNRCVKFPLPPARDGVIQILLEQGSDLLERLLDIRNEVFLR